jgi:chemotaxis protein MotB
VPPIIVIRKKINHGGHHGGAWKVAYADFVTAMMALFIVLWLLSSSEKVKKAVESYFQDPTGTGKLAGTTMSGKGEGLMLKPEDMAKLKDRIEQAMEQLPKFDQLKSHVAMTVTNEGLRIELLETEKGLFFDSGSSKLSPRGEEMLRMLAGQLKLLPNKLLVEGHTDAKPYGSETGYTNWELSADRANMARRVMQDGGVTQDQIAQVRGFADRHLRNAKDPMDPANRRVSVIVQYAEAPAAGAAKPGGEPEKKGQDEGNTAGNGQKNTPPAAQPAAHH